jgi:hypothetical protein
LWLQKKVFGIDIWIELIGRISQNTTGYGLDNGGLTPVMKQGIFDTAS